MEKLLVFKKLVKVNRGQMKSMFIKTNSPQEASQIISKLNDLKILKIGNDGVSILMSGDISDIYDIVKNLHEGGIQVESFYKIEENLEDKFIRMVGNNRHE